MLSALEALTLPDPFAGARALQGLCRSYELDEVATAVDAWLERRSGSVAGHRRKRATSLAGACG
jgi:hypothetical protein